VRERIKTDRGCAWLEAIGNGGFLVFGSETAQEALGVIVQERRNSRYLWRAWGDEEPLMAGASAKPTAVALVIAEAGRRNDGA
jgi:hypothetical protein